jgi:hypothetical protein
MRFVNDAPRQRFLSKAAGVAAGGTVLVAAPVSSLELVFGLIEAHGTVQAAHLVALAEQTRLEEIGDPTADWKTDPRGPT